jgi:hypothetical protein
MLKLGVKKQWVYIGGLTVIVIFCDTHNTHQPAAWRKAVVHNVKTFGTNLRQVDL